MSEALFFYPISSLMLGAALLVVFSRQPIYSVLSLLVAMFCMACLFVSLQAYFVAALQILLYAGAVLVLFLFVIMLLNLDKETLAAYRPFTRRGLGTFVAIVFCLELVWLVTHSQTVQSLAGGPAAQGTVEQIGRLLFTKYLLPFELTSFLILAAIIGAITLAKRTPNE